MASSIGPIDTHIRRSISWVSNGTTYLTYMFEAQRATRGPYSFRKWYTCRICGFDFPEDQVVLRGGAAYCIPYNHYYEIEKRRKR